MVAAHSRYSARSDFGVRSSGISGDTGNNGLAILGALALFSGSRISDDFGFQNHPTQIRKER